MNTFLPYPSFVQSASVLDNRRLGKQRVECYQILRTLAGETVGWRNHPAVRMWKGHELSLVDYGLCVCMEWVIGRGYRDTCAQKIMDLADEHGLLGQDFVPPLWRGNTDFHLSHQSNLVRKAPDHYRTYFPNVPDGLAYVWPV